MNPICQLKLSSADRSDFASILSPYKSATMSSIQDVSHESDWLSTPMASLAPVEAGLRCEICRVRLQKLSQKHAKEVLIFAGMVGDTNDYAL